VIWYKYALRKHYLRFDPRVQINLAIDDPNLLSYGVGFTTAAIVKGLDIIGLVSYDINVPLKIKENGTHNNIDLYVLAGQVIKTTDEYHLIVYGHTENFGQASLLDILNYCEQNNLLTLVYHLGKQKAKQLKNLTEKYSVKPTFVEIFNAKDKGYLYITTNTFEVVSSGLDNVRDFEKTNIYSLIQRKDLEEIRVIPEGEGKEYVPGFLKNI